MTQLKTLKDFLINEEVKGENLTSSGFYKGQVSGKQILAEQLKSEAIKWAREINAKEIINLDEEAGQIKWIKHFFGITDADLQELNGSETGSSASRHAAGSVMSEKKSK